jgi:hypothetical protein
MGYIRVLLGSYLELIIREGHDHSAIEIPARISFLHDFVKAVSRSLVTHLGSNANPGDMGITSCGESVQPLQSENLYLLCSQL